jgi:SAM-dependent methyltransferase
MVEDRQEQSDALMRVFDGLTLCAPADAAMLQQVIDGLSPSARILDAGCGRGADLPVLLAAVPQGQVVAVDLVAPFIAAVRARFPAVRAELADMLDPPGGPFDLIWAGGSAYGPGVGACLSAWRGHLAPRGRVALTDMCWRVSHPAKAARDFWAKDYPAMMQAGALEQQITAQGWHIARADWLPPSAMAAYYDPLEQRLKELAPDPALAQTCADLATEIAIWRAYGDAFGYRLLVLEPA